MIALKSCPVCDSDQIILFDKLGTAPRILLEIMPGVKVNAGIITHYSVCQNCKLIFQNPRLTDAKLDQFYSQGLYLKLLNLTTEQKDEDEMYRANFDTEIIKKHIDKVKSHLDVGCSRGYLLEKVGADIKVGVESNIGYVVVRNVKVYAKLNEVKQGPFDLVTAIHVLEHEPYPQEFLKQMAKFIGKGGFLVVEVPTWKSPGGPLRLAHLYHFEPDVLKLMCKQLGLSVIYMEFTPHLLLICKPAKN